MRAYINGESRYSKGQKDASLHLVVYINSGEPKYWVSFLEELKVPLGDSTARAGLLNNSTETIIRNGFLAGENHVDDVNEMIWLFRNFKDVSFMKRAIQIWKQADAKIGALALVGEKVRQKTVSGSFSLQEKGSLSQEVGVLTSELTTLEREFSDVLGATARKINTYLFYANIFLTLVIIGSAGYYSTSMIKKLSNANEQFKETLHFGKMGSAELDLTTSNLTVSRELFQLLQVEVNKPQVFPLEQFLATYVDPIYLSTIKQKIREGLAGINEHSKSMVETEFEMITATGRKIWIDAKGIFKGNTALGILHDVTEFKNAMEALEKLLAEKEDLISVKDKFFSIVSHDLRNPVDTLHSFILLVENHIENLSKQEIKMMVRDVNKSFLDTKVLMNDLTTWGQSQMNSKGAVLVPVDLKKSIDFIIDFTKEISAAKQITISYSGPDTLTVFADRYQIDFIIRNLISNALKFTHRGGKIDISMQTDQEYVRLSIQDSGIGISQEAMKNIFQMGKVRSTKGTEGERGTGLGLVLIKGFLEKNSGQIAVESIQGKGTMFHVSLPRLLTT